MLDTPLIARFTFILVLYLLDTAFCVADALSYTLQPIPPPPTSRKPMEMVSSWSPVADQEPLLQHSHPSINSITSQNNISTFQNDDEEVSLNHNTHLDRLVENGVLPEEAVIGRNLGWSSAYILIMSRVIGSGIFATPGAILRSVGSVGITLLLWIAGALISWLGLAITLEYGCMLPKSGGENSLIICVLADSQIYAFANGIILGRPNIYPEMTLTVQRGQSLSRVRLPTSAILGFCSYRGQVRTSWVHSVQLYCIWRVRLIRFEPRIVPA